MHKYYLLTALSCGISLAASGQITNAPTTQLQAFEERAGTVIVMGAGQAGSIALGDLTLSVNYKESFDITGGPRQYGVAIEFAQNNQRVDKMLLDYDELAPLLNSLDYLGKIDYTATTLPAFVAAYISKSGFRVGAYTSQRRGAIQYFVQDYSRPGERISLTGSQLTQLQSLIQEAKSNLDSMRTAH
jgi:hypothetical protein